VPCIPTEISGSSAAISASTRSPRPVAIETEVLGVDETGLQGEARIGFSGRATIRRSEFGLDGLTGDGTKIIVSDLVTIELDIEAVRDR
jgi:polyisoprenoid-binding protein YceI